MIINTTAEGISLARKLETESSSFYEGLAKKYPQGADVFLAFSKENKKNIANIESTYYSVITDAIEGCFAFNINSDDYTFDSQIPDNADYIDVIQRIIKIEDLIIKYYTIASEQARSLMADIPRVFLLIVKKRSSRKDTLEALIT